MQPDQATVRFLRRDIALQVSRAVRRLGATQVQAARKLGVPQPTISKILNGRVDSLSLELLIRLAVRADVFLTILTGQVPEEAGAFVSAAVIQDFGRQSLLSDEARRSRELADKRLTPSQRAEAFLEHSQLMAELHQAGRIARSFPAGKRPRS
jgi:predicted XRE-type DNA-binding protein